MTSSGYIRTVYGDVAKMTSEQVYQRCCKLDDKRNYKFFTQGKGRLWLFEDGETLHLDRFTDGGKSARQIRRSPDMSHDDELKRVAEQIAEDDRNERHVKAFKNHLRKLDRRHKKNFPRTRLFEVLDLVCQNGSEREVSIKWLAETLKSAKESSKHESATGDKC